MPIRISATGLLEVLHPETGAYVPAGTLLQTEGGLLTSLVPDQALLLSDIRNASSYLQQIETILADVRGELANSGTKASQSNTLLAPIAQIDTALNTVNQAINTLETLGEAANILLTAIKVDTTQVSSKLPVTLGAKLRTDSLSVALATDSTIFASLANLLSALTDGGANSVYSALAALSSKIPAALGAKLRTESLSVALATDSTIFASLTNILNALTGTGDNTVYSALLSLSGKIPATLGAKLQTESMSIALATDSTIFASLTNILNALSDGVSNSALSYLGTVAGAQHWKTPTKFNNVSPIINAAASATSSAAYTINSQSEAISLQNFFSATGLGAQFAVELRLTAGSTSLHDRSYYYRGDVACPYAASAGAFPGESPIIIPTYGYVQVVVHLHSIFGGGNVTTFAREIR